MFDQINKYQHHLHRLQDMRVLAQLAFVVIVLFVSYSGVTVIHTNYKLQQHIAQLQQENEVQKLKNANQKLRNEYYNTPQYLELAARQNFGLAAAGEKELLVPKAVALAHVPEDSATLAAQADEAGAVKTPFYQRNTRAWLDFFLHRTPVSD